MGWREIVLVMLVVSSASAQFGSPAESGTGRRSERAEAEAAIPYRELVPEASRRIHHVVSQPSVYRRLPLRTIACEPDLFVFLMRHPEVVVDIWRVMGVTQLSMDRTGPYQLRTTDGAGTMSELELVYGTKATHLYYGEGVYEGPLFKKKINGRCVILLRGYPTRSGERELIACRLDVFLQIEEGPLDAIAKTIHPLFSKTADINFLETAAFIEKLSEKAHENGSGMHHLANRLTRVTPDVRQQFAAIASTSAERSAQRVFQPVRRMSAVEPIQNRDAISVRGETPISISQFPVEGRTYR